jgi:hypothetical protein
MYIHAFITTHTATGHSQVARLEANASRGEQERSVLKYTAVYSVAAAVIAPYIGLIWLGAVADGGFSGKDIFFAGKGLFFAFFVIQAAAWGNAMALLRPREALDALWESRWLNRLTGAVPRVGRAAAAGTCGGAQLILFFLRCCVYLIVYPVKTCRYTQFKKKKKKKKNLSVLSRSERAAVFQLPLGVCGDRDRLWRVPCPGARDADPPPDRVPLHVCLVLGAQVWLHLCV